MTMSAPETLVNLPSPSSSYHSAPRHPELVFVSTCNVALKRLIDYPRR